jgi:hypothetical protein
MHRAHSPATLDVAVLASVVGGQDAQRATSYPNKTIIADGTGRTIDMGSGQFLLYVEKKKPNVAPATAVPGTSGSTSCEP